MLIFDHGWKGILVITLQVMFLGCITHAQINKRSEKAFVKGEELLAEKEYAAAKEAFLKCLIIDTTHAQAYYRLGGLASRDGQWAESKTYLIKALEYSKTSDPLLLYHLAEVSWQVGDYQDVGNYLSDFEHHAVKNPSIVQKAVKYRRDASFLLSNPIHHNIEITRLPNTINTDALEYLPSLPAKEDMMIFTRRVRGQEDFYYSLFRDGEWQEARSLTGLNTPDNEGAHCLSADGKLLIFTACHRKDGLGSCDLYYSILRDDQWTSPANMGAGVNTKAWEGQPSLSSNGQRLYFSSSRPGGSGGRDIWFVDRRGSGWSKPVNLSDINTPYNEESPHIHYDNVSLYFMSDGHPGYGGSDLFLSRFTTGQWQVPLNLGSPINSVADEGAVHVDRLGEIGYFARNDPFSTDRQIDIYEFPIPKEIRPTPSTYAQIKVINSKTQRPIQAVVEFYDTDSKRTLKKVTSKNGELLVCLTTGKDYSLRIDKEDYLFYSMHIALKGDHPLIKPYNVLAPLQPVEEIALHKEDRKPVVLRNVFFDSGKSELLEDSFIELNRLVQLLQKHPQMHIAIHGHTDDVGSDQDNLDLSQDRAQAVYQYLIDQGIQEDRLTYQGFGESKPMASNDSPEGRQSNRRTEFIVTQ